MANRYRTIDGGVKAEEKLPQSEPSSILATIAAAGSISRVDTKIVKSERGLEKSHAATPTTLATPEATTSKHLHRMNKVLTQRLDVYVFGAGEHGELGLGAAIDARDVKYPRLNHFLPSDSIGVVQVATGAAHVLALSYDHRIITWGSNDKGALGRDTKNADHDDDKLFKQSTRINAFPLDGCDESCLNRLEATPIAITQATFPKGTQFVQIAAGECSSFALTDTGLVYGWGTFRNNDGILGFTSAIRVQKQPMLLTDLKKITKLACGANHVLALDFVGRVYAWGNGQQNQLGRRIVERTRMSGLTPHEFGLPKKQIVDIAAGSYHNFALDKQGNVWAWGLNNYGECGISQRAGTDDATISRPTIVSNLAYRRIMSISAGAHHSIAIDDQGDCLVWGRVDGTQSGITAASLDLLSADEVKRDAKNIVRILFNPTKIPNLPACSFAAVGSSQTLVITRQGQAFSWGSSGYYQTGLGVNEDIEIATLVNSTAVRDKKLTWAGTGNQYSILTGLANEFVVEATLNGVRQ